MKPNFVSLHPYFKVHPGKLDAVKAAFPRFVKKTAAETENLFYGFTVNGDEILVKAIKPPRASWLIWTMSACYCAKC
jgi:quinol monooxygenase YgiN